jgi:hypothetical protein
MLDQGDAEPNASGAAVRDTSIEKIHNGSILGGAFRRIDGGDEG